MAGLIIKQTPELYPHRFEHMNFLSIGSWPKILADSTAGNLVSRWDLTNAKRQLVSEMLSEELQEIWPDRLQEWVGCCLKDELPFEQAVHVFVNTIFLRYIYLQGSSTAQDEAALMYLRSVNDDNWQIREPMPKEGFYRSLCGLTYNARDRPSPSRPAHAQSQQRSAELSESFANMDLVDLPLALPMRHRGRSWDSIIGMNSFYDQCLKWNRAFCDFIYHPGARFDPSSGPVNPVLTKYSLCGRAMAEIRKVPKSTYRKEQWLQAVYKSGLASTMLVMICRGFMYTRARDVVDTPNLDLWANTVADVLHQWTPDDALTADAPLWQPFDLKLRDPAKTPKGREFLDVLIRHEAAVPYTGNCFVIFFLHDQHTFVACWEDWLLPVLLTAGQSDAVYWDPVLLFKRVSQVITGKNLDLKRVPPMLSQIIESTIEHKKVCRDHHKWVWHRGQVTPAPQSAEASVDSSTQKPSQEQDLPHKSMRPRTCRRCAGLPEDQRCVQRVFVHQHELGMKLDGDVITLAPPGDRIQPLSVPALKHGKKRFRYHSPTDLGFKRHTFRPDVYARCGRDATVFIDQDTDKNIGGVVYNAFSPSVLKKMQESHRLVSLHKTCKRRPTLQSWALGQMIPIGARAPQGGKPGDGYTAYKDMTIQPNDVSAVAALMAHARDGELLLDAIHPYYPGIKAEYDNLTDNGGLHRLGRHGINMYYCSDYMAPIHSDNDVSTSLCCQTTKTGVRDGEFDFCYAKYGFYIETKENAAWWFNSTDPHGTVMPSRSSMSEDAVGQFSTLPVAEKDVPSGTELGAPSRAYSDVRPSTSEASTTAPSIVGVTPLLCNVLVT